MVELNLIMRKSSVHPQLEGTPAGHAIARATKLSADAKILFGHGSLNTSASLCMLSIEESGKACLLLWKTLNLLSDAIFRKSLLSHISKQRVYSAYVRTCSVLKVIEEDWNKLQDRKINYLRVDELLSKGDQADLREANNNEYMIEIGFWNLIKFSGFYSGVDGVADHAEHNVECSEEFVSYAIQQSESALLMASQPTPVHVVVANAFLRGPALSFGDKRVAELRGLLDKLQEAADKENART